MNSERIQKTQPLATTEVSTILNDLLKRVRWTMDIPGEFLEFYKLCDGMSVVDREGVTWKIRPLAEVEDLLIDNEPDTSPDGIHHDSETLHSDGSVWYCNERYMHICDASDGSVVYLKTRYRLSNLGIYDVILIKNEEHKVVFLGLKNFLAYLAEKAEAA